MDGGYIGLYRKLIDSWIFKDALILRVFIYFLCKATKEQAKVDVNGQVISLIPGQLVSGRKHLMEELQLTERQARRSLDELKNNKVIDVRTSSIYSIVTVLKYNHYQGILNKNRSNSVQHIKPVEETIMEKPDQTADFDKFWIEYPKKQAKIMAVASWKKIKPSKPLYAEIMKGLKAAKQSEQWQKDRGKFIPMPSTWLNQRRWEDEYESAPEVSKGVGELPTEL